MKFGERIWIIDARRSAPKREHTAEGETIPTFVVV